MTEAAPSPIHDSTQGWVKAQIDEYVATHGAKPVFRYGAPLVLITFKGRKSGEWRRTCLIGASDGDDVIIVASKGGAPEHPVWYRNIEADPRVWVQQGAESFWTLAHTADASEKPRLWEKMVGLYPDYADYQVKTDRDIPVVVLVREKVITSGEVATSTFTPVRFREGYDMNEVDRFLAKVRDALASYERRTGEPATLSATDVINTRFQPTRFRSGYNQDEVDNFLDQVVVALRSYEGTGQPTVL